MDDTSSHTGRMVKSACASHALQRLLADHGRLLSAAPPATKGQPPLGSLGDFGGPAASQPSTYPPNPSGGITVEGLPAGDGEGDASAGAGLRSRVGPGSARIGADYRADGLEASVEGDQGIGRGGKGLELERSLPFYLHVSGWLDASAHAAIMAFTTVPCRCDFFFMVDAVSLLLLLLLLVVVVLVVVVLALRMVQTSTPSLHKYSGWANHRAETLIVGLS